ncbi:MAG: YfhO family protein [Eubacteriales bacterium]|nr:YfhO family protein [Eubacteriales bacterium]
MQKLQKKGRTIWILLALLFGSGLVIYAPFLFGDAYLTFTDIGSDTWQQYIMQYHSIVNHLRDGTFSLWDFSNGFGVNVYQMNLFDPSLMLLYALGVFLGPEHMLDYLAWIQILRILAAGLMGYLFLSAFSLSERAKLFAAYIYGLNGFLMVWGQHYQFGMVMFYLPFLLLMAERSLRAKKIRPGLPLAVCLTMFYSTYLSYMCCLTTGIYLIFRVLLMEGCPVKRRLLVFGKVCLGMLLGVGMGLCVMLPSAFVILGVTSRLESEQTLIERLLAGFLPLDREYYKTLLYRFFSANLQNKNGDYAGAMNYYEAPQVFASTFFVIFSVQYVLTLAKRKCSVYKKAVLYGAVALVIFSLLFPFVGTVYNGFSAMSSRYTFALMPFFALMMARMLDYFLEGGKGNLPGMLAAGAAAVYVYRMGLSVTTLGIQKALTLGMAVVAVLGVFCVGIQGTKKTFFTQKTFWTAMMALAVLNMCLEGIGTVTDRQTVTADDTEYLAYVYDPDVADALAWISENDPEFYRVEKTFSENDATMYALAQGYHGVSTYNSMQNGNIQQFIDVCRPEIYYADQNHYSFSQIADDGEFAAFLGVRYLLSKGEAPEGYEYLQSFGEIQVYGCEETASIGTFYSEDRVISEEIFVQKAEEAESTHKTDRILEKYLALENGGDADSEAAKQAEKTDQTALVTVREDGRDSRLTGSIEAPGDGYVLFTIPFEKGWTITVDGEAQELVRADLGFTAVRVEEGSHTFTLSFHAPYLKEGIGLSLVFWLLYLGYLVVYAKQERTKTT